MRCRTSLVSSFVAAVLLPPASALAQAPEEPAIRVEAATVTYGEVDHWTAIAGKGDDGDDALGQAVQFLVETR